ncbi:hypothetical protein SLS56_011704 [Neofusicoccum ribis]|uniref:Microtubule associated protein n=1 Tax=Neofusicoccum ribis TaxID=45134 RepID=A0ABR3SAX2_9PEZI
MEVPTPRPKKPVLAKAGKTIGFQKRYNFILFVIFGGAMLGFTLAKFQYLNYDKIYCNRERTGLSTASPGECYWYDRGFYRIGMLMHLGGTLPAGFLTVFQFIPVIRYTSMVFHRINGYLVLVLFLVSNAGMFMFVRHSFGGELETQVASGTLAIMSVGAMSLAYYNVKMLQIDQHRAWMLRGWFYAGCIITVRIILIITAVIVGTQKNYYTARPCYQLDYIFKTREATLQHYPECIPFYNGTSPGQMVVVNAKMGSTAAEASAALGISFGMSMWLALALHAIGVELQLTPREAERLRLVSYKRQLEAGMRNPGSAGITVEKLGDARPWVPTRQDSDSTVRFTESPAPGSDRHSNVESSS